MIFIRGKKFSMFYGSNITFEAGVSVTYSMNVQGVSLEVHYTPQYVRTTRVAALEPGLEVGESKMGLHVLLQHIPSRNAAPPPFICKLFIPYADKAHWMR